jgi:hypothetical protein
MRRKFEEKKQKLAARRLTRVKRAPVKAREDLNETDETDEIEEAESRVFTRKPIRSVKLLSKVLGPNVCKA